MKSPPRLLLLASLFGATAPLSAVVTVSDVFADGESLTQNVAANSLRLFNGRTTNTRTDAFGSTSFTIGNASADGFWAFFTQSTPLALVNNGDSITVRVVFSVAGISTTAATDIRFGIGDSKATRNLANPTGGMADATFADDTIYGGTLGITSVTGGSATPFVISKRVASASLASPNSPFNSAADMAKITTENSGSTGNGSRQPLTAGQDYLFTYTILKSRAIKMHITSSLSGPGITQPYTYSASDLEDTRLFTSFDWVCLRITGSGFASSMTFKKNRGRNQSRLHPTTKSLWRLVAELNLEPVANTSILLDTDNDGLVNGLEYVLGLNPTISDYPADGLLKPTPEGDALVVHYLRRKDTSTIPSKLQWTTDPTTAWTDAVHGVNGVTITAEGVDYREDVTVTIPKPDAATKLFVRLKIEKP